MSKVVSFVQIIPTIPQKTHLYCKYCLCRIDRALEVGEKSYGYEVQMGNSKLILCYDCLSALLPNKSFNRLEVLQEFEIERLIKLIRKFNSDSTYNPRGFGNNNIAFEDFEYLRHKYQTEYKEEMNKLRLNKQENKDSKNDDWGDDFIPQVTIHGKPIPRRIGLRHLSVFQDENTPIRDLDEEEEVEIDDMRMEEESERAADEIIFSNPPPTYFPASPHPWMYRSPTYTTSSSYYIPLDNQG